MIRLDYFKLCIGFNFLLTYQDYYNIKFRLILKTHQKLKFLYSIILSQKTLKLKTNIELFKKYLSRIKSKL
jgi:hypothetical protein